MTDARRSLAPTVLICALLAALALAATASAEVRVGEKTAAPDASIPAEADVIAAHAEYDSTTGSVVFQITTAAAPQTLNPKGEENQSQMVGALFSPRTCGLAFIGRSGFPLLSLKTSYAEGARTFWELVETEESTPEAPDTEGPAIKASAGTTTTLSVATAKVADQGFSCAVVGVVDPASPGELKPLVFPIAAPPPPPPPADTTPTTTTTVAPVQSVSPAPPAPAPAALSIARSRPLKLKPGKLTPVRIKVTNTGGTSSVPGSLRVKGTKGVTVKPETQRLPLLPPGGSWTVTAKVRLTKQAKAKSTLALTAAAGATVAKGSLVPTAAKPAKRPR